MESIKLLLVEDDRYNQKIVSHLLATNFPEIQVVAIVDNVEDSRSAIEEYRPDLLILDIHLKEGTCFELLRDVNNSSFKVVFMSAYHEFVLEALEFSAVDFIFKPIDANDLVIAIEKVIDELQEDNYQIKLKVLFRNMQNGIDDKQIVMQGEESVKVFQVNEIVWGKAVIGGAIFYFVNGESFFVPKPLRRYEALLASHGFFRCHPHNLVSFRYIKKVDEAKRMILLSNGELIEFEWRKYPLLLRQLEPAVFGDVSI